MRLTRSMSRFGAGVFIVSSAVIATMAGRYVDETKVAAAQAGNGTQARPPLVDEYYPVKSDWIGSDRSILTIKHLPTASCYILLYPSGDALMPVEKEHCAVSGALEK